MKKKLVIDGNAIYEIDEECMIQKQKDESIEKKGKKSSGKNIRNK